jgi:hypothetical protein
MPLAPKSDTTVVADADAGADIAVASREVMKPARGGTTIDWATLLERVHHVDALACPRCNASRLTFIAVITDRQVARKILDCVGEASDLSFRRRRSPAPFPVEFDVAPPYD